MTESTPTERVVLVVDDDEDLVEVLVELLGGEGYRVLTACHGAAALALVEEHGCPPVVLVDYMMPGLDGAELVSRLDEFCRTQRGERPSFFLMSALPSARERERFEGLPVAAFVSKPLPLDLLLERILEAFVALERKRSQPPPAVSQ